MRCCSVTFTTYMVLLLVSASPLQPSASSAVSSAVSSSASCACYLSPNGSDTGEGTSTSPFLAPQSCVDRAKAATLVICVGPGVYSAVPEQPNLVFGNTTATDILLRADDSATTSSPSSDSVGAVRPVFNYLYALCVSSTTFSLNVSGVDLTDFHVMADDGVASVSITDAAFNLTSYDVRTLVVDQAFGASTIYSQNVRSTDATYSISNSSFSGGSLHFYGAKQNLTLTGSTFKNCNFTIPYLNLHIAGCTLTGNQINIIANHLIVRDTVFVGNLLAPAYDSGIVVLDSFTASDSTFACTTSIFHPGAGVYVPSFSFVAFKGGEPLYTNVSTRQDQCPVTCPPSETSADGLMECGHCFYPGVVWNSTFCADCPGGTTVENASAPRTVDNCQPCKPGNYANNETSVCFVCGYDDYQPDSGQTSCLTCSLPGHANYPESTECIVCPDKQVWDLLAKPQAKCVPCGFFGMPVGCSFFKTPFFVLLIIGAVVCVVVVGICTWHHQRKNRVSEFQALIADQ